MDKRLELWNKAGELFFKFENTLKSPMQNEVKFVDDEILEFSQIILEYMEELNGLTYEVLDYMNENKEI